MNQEEKVSWIYNKLSSLLSFPVPPDLIDYICSIKNERDFIEYFSTLLDFSNAQHKQFVNDLRDIMPIQNTPGEKILQPKMQITVGLENLNIANSNQEENKSKKRNNKSTFRPLTNKDKESDTGSMVTTVKQPSDGLIAQTQRKKRTKYVNLFSQEGQAKDVVLLKGRHLCTCEATMHKLINNCMRCGRIVCEQEGVGPCLFCGNLVCTAEQMLQLEAGTKRSDKLRDHLMKQTLSSEGLAIQKRDRMLAFDRDSERVTRVIDDQSDYYDSGSVWLSAEERALLKQREAELHEQRFTSRKDRKITLDFSGRCVIAEEPESPIDPMNDPILLKINESITIKKITPSSVQDADIHPEFSDLFCLKYIDSEQGKPVQRAPKEQDTLYESRIQDREMLEMSDRGMCLSMHQPWASLLINGLKMHEGRSWYTAHRGILWIASAAKQPTPAEIQSEEMHIRTFVGGSNELHFPRQYPVGCLLGCVNVVDCLSQEDYRIQYPNGPSSEPFVFICQHPRRLPICFPLKGKHKIFKLDSKIHLAAQKSLQRVAKLQAETTLDDS